MGVLYEAITRLHSPSANGHNSGHNADQPCIAIVLNEDITLGTAYTIWTGIGAVGAFLVGIAVLGESVTTARVIAALLIVSGLALMKLSSST